MIYFIITAMCLFVYLHIRIGRLKDKHRKLNKQIKINYYYPNSDKK